MCIKEVELESVDWINLAQHRGQWRGFKHDNWSTSPSWKATQETPRFLWNPKVRYRVHKSPPCDNILDSNNTAKFVDM